jgi:hypothetical protein
MKSLITASSKRLFGEPRMAEDRYGYEGAEERRRRTAAERAERGETVEIGTPAGRPRRVVARPEREKKEMTEASIEQLEKCREDCSSLAEDLGEMNQQELEDWRKNLAEQREDASARKDIADWAAFQREIGCVTKWRNECEPELSECAEDGKEIPCKDLRDEFQSGTTNVLSKQARDFIAEEALEKAGDETLPRNEVVTAQKRLNCLGKYEGCIEK